MHMREAGRGHLSMSESVTLLPLPKDIKIGVGAAFIKAHGGMLPQTDPNTDLIAWMTWRRRGLCS